MRVILSRAILGVTCAIALLGTAACSYPVDVTVEDVIPADGGSPAPTASASASTDGGASSGSGRSGGSSGTGSDSGSTSSGGGSGGSSGSGSGGSSGPASMVLVADSAAQFAGTQGQDGWQYGSETAPGFVFTPMTQFDGTTWWVDQGTVWTRLWDSGGHPNGTVTSNGREPILQYAVRRWTSNVDATVQVEGHVAKDDTNAASHGIVVEIDVDGVSQYQQSIGGQDGVGVDYSFTCSVKQGSNIDFILMPAADGVDYNDTSTFTAQIYE